MKKIGSWFLILSILIIGYWLISPFFIDIKVSESLPSVLTEEIKSSNISTKSLITRSGIFVGFDAVHNGTGTVSIYSFTNPNTDGVDGSRSAKYILRFEEGFQVNNGPDLYVGFGKDGQYIKGSEISKLKGNVGSQNYEIPVGVDLDAYDSVWVWCKAFATPFIKADLNSVVDANTNLSATSKDTKNITYMNSTADMIQVELPFPNAVVGKDFSVIGKARGNWFFEASFPVEVLDKDGKVLAIGIAKPQNGEDWMTTQFVNFKADIKIPQAYIGKATLVLKKDNPSGLSIHDAAISFPIVIEY